METGNVGIENLPLMRGPIRTDDLKRPRRPQHVLSRFKRGAGDGVKPAPDGVGAGTLDTVKQLPDGGDSQGPLDSVIEKHFPREKGNVITKLKDTHITPCISPPSDPPLCKPLERNRLELEARARAVSIENGLASQQKVLRCGELGDGSIVNSAARRQRLLSQRLQRQGSLELPVKSDSEWTRCSDTTPSKSAANVAGPEVECLPSLPTVDASSTQPYQISPVRLQRLGSVLDPDPGQSSSSPTSDLEGGSQSGVLSSLSATRSELESTVETSPATGSEWGSTDEASSTKGLEKENMKETSATGEERESSRATSPFGAAQETWKRRVFLPKRAAQLRRQCPLTSRCDDDMSDASLREPVPSPGTLLQEPLLTAGTSSQEPLATSESSQQELSGSAKLPSSGVNYVKLWVSDGTEGPGYALTLVASDMSKLMDISSLLTSTRDAAVVNFGTSSEALVDEVSEQIGMPLTMIKLHALPPGGRYSAQKLVELSASRLSRQKPPDWQHMVDKCEREKIGYILLKGEDVKYFEPSDWKMPEVRGFMNTETGRARSRLKLPQDQSVSDLPGRDGEQEDLDSEGNSASMERRGRSLDSSTTRVSGGFSHLPADCVHTQKAALHKAVSV